MLFITQNVPVSLRGELTKWMLQLKAGVFLGTLSTRVGEKLWVKIQEKQGKGGAIWVKAANNEQRFKMAICGNTNWIISDFDGLQLITHPKKHYANRKKEVSNQKKIQRKFIRSKEIMERVRPSITWNTKNTPNNFITREALFKYKKSLFSSKYTGTSAYREYPSQSLWKKPWTDDIENISKSLLSLLRCNSKFYISRLIENKIACLDIETTDYLPKAYEGFVNIIGISILNLNSYTSDSDSVLLFQAFNMTRKKENVPTLLKLVSPYLENIDTLIVFNKNFDIKILTTIIKEFNLNITLPKKIIDLKEKFPNLITLEQYLTDKVGIKRKHSEKGKYSEYYKLFKGKGKEGLNKKIEPIGTYNLTDTLTPLYAYLLLRKNNKLE